MTKYYYEGHVIKLNKKDYLEWWHSLSHWRSEPEYLRRLTEIDDFLSKQDKVGNWFIRASKQLQNDLDYMTEWGNDACKTARD